MMLLIVGLIAFFAIHLIPANPDLRKSLVERFGEGGYKGAFAVASLAAFAVIVMGFGKMQHYLGSKNPVLFEAPMWSKHLAAVLMVVSFVALASAYFPSPTRIAGALKHPMLVAVKVWALAHLMANGDVASLALFSSFLAYAVYARISLKRRGDTGRSGEGARLINDAIVVGIGLTLYLLMAFYGHALLIGVPVIG
ncbi:MAG: NnrU family protein [Alphaproteobacteria bacterium]|nr:NnrU family protein [Alphaproteobacteria bacterium]